MTTLRDHDIWLTNWLEERSVQVQVARNVKIERFLQGSEQLSFELKLDDPKMALVHEDQTIEAYGDKWVVDHFEDVKNDKQYRRIVCNAYWIKLSWKAKVGTFSILGKTPAEGIDQILKGTGWTQVNPPGEADLFTVEDIDATALSLLRRWAAVTGFELNFDTMNKTVELKQEVGSVKPIGFRWGYNISEIKRTYYPPQATRLYPVGANDLSITNTNPTGLSYIENYDWYLDQGLTLAQAKAGYQKDLIWVDNRYLLEVSLYDAAVARLEKLSKPRIFYAAKVIDLSRVMGVDADPLTFGYIPGDYVPVDDEDFGLLEQVRITRTVSYPAEPKRDEVELGFLTNGLLDVSDGGNRDIDYNNIFLIVDENVDPVNIGPSEVAYNSIVLTSAGEATVITGSTFVGTATGDGVVRFQMTLDGAAFGEPYEKPFDAAVQPQIEFSWPSFVSGIGEGSHDVQWTAQVVSGSGTILLGETDGRSWVMSRGAVGVGRASSPNQFINEELPLVTPVSLATSDPVVTFYENNIDQIILDVDGTITEPVPAEISGLLIIPFTVESPTFGALDGVASLSAPGDPAPDNYSPPFGGAARSSENFGPFGDEVISGNWIAPDDLTAAGGIESYVQDGSGDWWKVLQVNSSGDVVVANTAGTAKMLLIGGGGGGSRAGGGAGEYVDEETVTLSVGTHAAVIGVGGLGFFGASADPGHGADGGDSTFGGKTAKGGGGGSGDDTATGPTPSRDGGSGGGEGAYGNPPVLGGGLSTASDGVGNAGGSKGTSSPPYPSGGGGGAGTAGGDGVGPSTSGDGGDGLAWDLDGVFRAAGGGGATYSGGTHGSGGNGGGGDGGTNGQDATQNTGSGGGGAESSGVGGDGADGVLLLAVPAPGYTPPTGPEDMDVSFTHMYRANGPAFLAQGIADGAAVATYPDEIGGIDMNLTGSTLTASDAKLNGEPSVFINGNGDQASAMAAAQGTIVVIAWHPTAGGDNRWHDNHSGGRWIMGIYSGTWEVYYGSSAGQSVSADTDAHLFLYHEDGSNDEMELDGTVIYGPSNYGNQRVSQINIVDDGDGVHIALLATHASDPRNDPDWAVFEQWVEDTYGITIA